MTKIEWTDETWNPVVGVLLALLLFGAGAWALTGLNAPLCVAWKWPKPGWEHR